MKAEKAILSFIAILVGLIAAGVAFYFYQMTRTIPAQKAKPLSINASTSPSPTPDKSNFLNITEPKDEEVFDKKVITVSGKTDPQATIIVSSEDSDQVVKPATNGDFSLTQILPGGTSLIQITAVFSNGEEKKVMRTVTSTTESF